MTRYWNTAVESIPSRGLVSSGLQLCDDEGHEDDVEAGEKAVDGEVGNEVRAVGVDEPASPAGIALVDRIY